jgi:hypothetical protein
MEWGVMLPMSIFKPALLVVAVAHACARPDPWCCANRIVPAFNFERVSRSLYSLPSEYWLLISFAPEHSLGNNLGTELRFQYSILVWH